MLFEVRQGDCAKLAANLSDESIDIIVTSPPYWGQRMSLGHGVEEDPRDYISGIGEIFEILLPKLKYDAIVWLNVGDAYNTPINWRFEDKKYSSLGHERDGLSDDNTAYTKPRAKRKAFIDQSSGWLKYGNLLSLPHRLVQELCSRGYYFRGEVIWKKLNPMPEGRCRRPHRAHEPIFLLSKSERHRFRVQPPVSSVWEFPSERMRGEKHFSRFPLELPKRCIEAFGETTAETLVCDPFTGSGTTGIAAINANCQFIGFEIDADQHRAASMRIEQAAIERGLAHECAPTLDNEARKIVVR
ncbi:site-specific DNA-methyltransferase [Qipengyuania mesophila]|uniref:DNA-methyltransferase n=1 Tax=Erythrobacteraceae TaxID=335929 RepID=UPI0035190C29